MLAPVETSMVFFDPSSIGITLEDLITILKEKEDITISSNRLVIHHQISDEAVEKLINVIELISSKKLQPLSNETKYGNIYLRKRNKWICK